MQQKQEIIDLKGRYKIHGLIGEGAAGQVYKGYDNQRNIDVAIKVQNKWSQYELDFLTKFQYSTFLNVINVYDFFQEGGVLIIIMEYAKGKDLLDYYENTLLNPDEIRNIILKISKGLQELHEQNFVYRDMKPENIIVLQENQSKPTFKICDFGLIKQEDLTMTKRVGTPYYQAPELLIDDKLKYKSEVDIWALGCVYFEIITKNSLFFGNSQEELQQQIRETKQEWIDNQIDNLVRHNIIERDRKLIKLMISIDPKRRPDIMEVIKTIYGSNDFLNKPQQKQQIINPTQINKISQPSPIKINQNPIQSTQNIPYSNPKIISANLNIQKPPIQQPIINCPPSQNIIQFIKPTQLINPKCQINPQLTNKPINQPFIPQQNVNPQVIIMPKPQINMIQPNLVIQNEQKIEQQKRIDEVINIEKKGTLIAQEEEQQKQLPQQNLNQIQEPNQQQQQQKIEQKEQMNLESQESDNNPLKQQFLNYQSQLKIIIDIINQNLSQTEKILNQLQQIQLKTPQIDNQIQIYLQRLENYKKQQLDYQQSLKQGFDQKNNDLSYFEQQYFKIEQISGQLLQEQDEQKDEILYIREQCRIHQIQEQCKIHQASISNSKGQLKEEYDALQNLIQQKLGKNDTLIKCQTLLKESEQKYKVCSDALVQLENQKDNSSLTVNEEKITQIVGDMQTYSQNLKIQENLSQEINDAYWGSKQI